MIFDYRRNLLPWIPTKAQASGRRMEVRIPIHESRSHFLDFINTITPARPKKILPIQAASMGGKEPR